MKKIYKWTHAVQTGSAIPEDINLSQLHLISQPGSGPTEDRGGEEGIGHRGGRGGRGGRRGRRKGRGERGKSEEMH